MYVMFLWLIVFINIMFAFNLVSMMPFGMSNGIDYSNKYFGVSTLIQFIQDLDVERDFPFVYTIRSWISDIQRNINDFMQLDWSSTWSIEVNSWESFWTAFGSFFANLFKSIGMGFTMIFMIACWFVYFAFYLIAFLNILLKLLSGTYFSVVPTTPLTPLITDTILLFA